MAFRKKTTRRTTARRSPARRSSRATAARRSTATRRRSASSGRQQTIRLVIEAPAGNTGAARPDGMTLPQVESTTKKARF